MRKSTAMLMLTAVAAGSFATVAAAPAAACDAGDTTLVTSKEAFEADGPGPLPQVESTSFWITTAEDGDLTTTMSWATDSDYDLYLYEADGTPAGSSYGEDLLAGGGTESITIEGAKACTVYELRVTAFFSLPDEVVTVGAEITPVG